MLVLCLMLFCGVCTLAGVFTVYFMIKLLFVGYVLIVWFVLFALGYMLVDLLRFIATDIALAYLGVYMMFGSCLLFYLSLLCCYYLITSCWFTLFIYLVVGVCLDNLFGCLVIILLDFAIC